MSILLTVILLMPIHKLINIVEADDLNEIASIFEGFGYSPVCVASALSSCELRKKVNIFPNSLNQNFPETNSINTRAKNCYELQATGDTTSGVRIIYPYDCCQDKSVFVYCDHSTDGGGWTVIQNRDSYPTREDFFRSWIEYTLGFGNMTGEFWLGLNDIHALVSTTLMELRIDLEDYEGSKRWAKYGFFHVGDGTSKYKLSIGRYSGDAGDGFMATNHNLNGMMFSTYDHDNDVWEKNCATFHRGGWWYDKCHVSNLNGFQHVGAYQSVYGEGIDWYPFRGYYYSLKKTSLKIRPVFKV